MDIYKRKYIHPKEYADNLDKVFGSREWVDFAPDTIWLSIKEAFNLIPDDVVKNKINALKILLGGERYFVDPMTFEKVVMAFNDVDVIWDSWQAPPTHAIAYAVTVSNELYTEEFDDNIVEYIRGISIKLVGLIYFPEVLKFAQPVFPEKTLQAAIIRDIESKKLQYPASKYQMDLLQDVESYVAERLKKGKNRAS